MLASPVILPMLLHGDTHPTKATWQHFSPLRLMEFNIHNITASALYLVNVISLHHSQFLSTKSNNHICTIHMSHLSALSTQGQSTESTAQNITTTLLHSTIHKPLQGPITYFILWSTIHTFTGVLLHRAPFPSLVGNAVCCDKFKKYITSLSLCHYKSLRVTGVHHRLHHRDFTKAIFNNNVIIKMPKKPKKRLKL